MNLQNVEADVSYKATHVVVNTDITPKGVSGIHPHVMSGVPEDDGEKRGKPGPEPDRLKLDVPFEESLRRALEKKRPAHGWPKPEESGEETEGEDGA